MPHVTFIHGIANKPDPDRLLTIWEQALAKEDGINLGANGVSCSMVYWADVMYESPSEPGSAHESTGAEVETVNADEDLAWVQELEGAESDFCNSLTRKLNFDAESPEDDEYQPEEGDGEIPYQQEVGDGEVQTEFERIPLPWFIKRRLMKVLLRDVHHYLFNTKHSPRPGETYRVQDEIRRRFIETLTEDAANNSGGPHIVVSHSMGTVISYDCLKRVAECPKVDGYLTIGCPLGIDEVQDKLQPEWSRNNGYPSERMLGDWYNVFDRLDPVAFDTKLANDFKLDGTKKVEDRRVHNEGVWRHDISKYLARSRLRDALKSVLEL